MDILAFIIILLHVIFVLFVVLTPFLGSNYFLVLHSFVVPFMMMHWTINNNACILTIIEHQIRCLVIDKNIPICESFTYKLISPVYDFRKNHSDYSSFIYIITILLWTITMCKLLKKLKNKEIKSLDDLLRT